MANDTTSRGHGAVGAVVSGGHLEDRDGAGWLRGRSWTTLACSRANGEELTKAIYFVCVRRFTIRLRPSRPPDVAAEQEGSTYRLPGTYLGLTVGTLLPREVK